MQAEKRNEKEIAKNLPNLKKEANIMPQIPKMIPCSLKESDSETDAPKRSPLAAPIPRFPREEQRRIRRSARIRPREMKSKTTMSESAAQNPNESARNAPESVAGEAVVLSRSALKKDALTAEIRISKTESAVSKRVKPPSARKTKFMQVAGMITESGTKYLFFTREVPENTKCAVKIRMRQAMYLSELIFSKADRYPKVAPSSPSSENLLAPSAALAESPKGALPPRKTARERRKEEMNAAG